MPLIFEVLLQATTGLLTAFVPWFWAFMILRFLAAAATGGTMITSFVLIMEIVVVTPSEPIWIHSLFVLTGISGTFLGFPTIYIWSGELFPTSIRNSGMGICSMSGRVGSMIAPFVADIQSGKGWMSPFIFGVVPLIGAALCYFLPETLNCQLPKSIEDVENLEMARKKARR
nr:solute carrier family 22 member 6-like [Leptinotarsa decemlineata]